jgi:serine/threonine protein kinase
VAALQNGLVVAERFRLDKPLGRGGMGEVWRAQHLSLDIPCAVKFIRDDHVLDARTTSRFRHEARAAAKLRSANVVQILDHGIWEGHHYIAMELLEGESVRDRLERMGRLSNGQTLTIVRDVCRALSRARELSIVHRDLKPDNLFIVKDADREIVKVLDFGIAKVPITEATQHTKTGALIGTPFYMSPEQAQGDSDIDGRSDLWSLAVIAFACLTGHLPFKSTALGGLLKEIMISPIPMPSEVAPDLPPELDRWWERAVDRDPDARYQTPEELADAFEKVLMGRIGGKETLPIGAPTPSLAVLAFSETLQVDKSTHAPLSSDLRALASNPNPPPASTGRSSAPWALGLLAILGIGGVVAWRLGNSETSGTAPAAEVPSTTASIPGESPTVATTEEAAVPDPTASAAASASASASTAEVAGPAPSSLPSARKPVPWKKPAPKATVDKPKPDKPFDPGY